MECWNIEMLIVETGDFIVDHETHGKHEKTDH
jgi:hypothetical protein